MLPSERTAAARKLARKSTKIQLALRALQLEEEQAHSARLQDAVDKARDERNEAQRALQSAKVHTRHMRRATAEVLKACYHAMMEGQ